MVTRNEWYTRVNNTWPSEVPKPSPEEAIKGAKKLYRFAFGRTFTGTARITTGNRYTWVRKGVLSVNAANGWDGEQGIVHLLSHYAHRRVHPGIKPHTGTHARLEIRMIKEVLKRGWLGGTLQQRETPTKPQVDPKKEKHERILVRIKRWESKQQRAERALKKLRRQAKYYA